MENHTNVPNSMVLNFSNIMLIIVNLPVYNMCVIYHLLYIVIYFWRTHPDKYSAIFHDNDTVKHLSKIFLSIQKLICNCVFFKEPKTSALRWNTLKWAFITVFRSVMKLGLQSILDLWTYTEQLPIASLFDLWRTAHVVTWPSAGETFI